MRGFRKFIGVFLIVFIGLPVLFGIIWAVGLTRAAVSPEFLTDLPKEIIAKIPTLINETLEEADQEGVIEDENTHTWLRAMANVDTKPNEVLERIGVMNWLRNDLTNSLNNVGKILRGEARLHPVILDMRPLKAALLHKELDTYLLQVIKKLPPCTEYEIKQWTDAVMQDKYCEKLPACQPSDPERALEIVKLRWEKKVAEIPDSIDLIKYNTRHFHEREDIEIVRFVFSLTYLLFLIPAIFLGLAALIGSSSTPGFLRWMGYPTLIGSGLAYGLSQLCLHFVKSGMIYGPSGYSYSEFHWSFPMRDVVFDRGGEIAQQVARHLLSSVNQTAGIVFVIGIVFIALSYLLFTEKKSNTPQQPQTPKGNSTPSNPSTPEPSPATPTPETAISVSTPETTVSETPAALPEPPNQASSLPYPTDSDSQSYPGLQ